MAYTDFLFPHRNGQPLVYLCGHSLGLQPKNAGHFVQEEMERWASLAVDGHFTGSPAWMDFHNALAPASAYIVGAQNENEVAVMNTLSVNIHLMLATFFNASGKKKKILMEAPAFPSDQYAVETHLSFLGQNPDEDIIEIPFNKENYLLNEDQICQTIIDRKDEIALVFLGGVQYISGQVLDMERIARTCQECDIICGFDLAHAVGNVQLKLSEWGVDFATWCCYKYLNGGPGTLGGIYINQRHLPGEHLPRLAGWWGYKRETRFKMTKGFVPTEGADGWALSNPPIIAMAPLRASLPMFQDEKIPDLIARSKTLTGQLREVFNQIPGAKIYTPENGGCMLTIAHPEARSLFEHFQKEGIIGDWREPGIIRLAPTPMYNTEDDIAAVKTALESFSETGR